LVLFGYSQQKLNFNFLGRSPWGCAPAIPQPIEPLYLPPPSGRGFQGSDEMV
jgi:hypothetical protein